MIEIIPSLPAVSFEDLAVKAGMVRGVVDTFQIDVADGMFVTNRSWPMQPGDDEQFQRIVSSKERLPYAEELQFEVHFMAHEPEKLLEEWGRAGIIRALFHLEAKHTFSAFRAVAERFNIEVGAAIKLGTDIERLAPYLPHLAVVQVMGIDPIGVQGQPFDERAVDTVRAIRERFPDVTIAVDGAVNDATAPALTQAGATRLAPGSFIFSSSDPARAVSILRGDATA